VCKYITHCIKIVTFRVRPLPSLLFLLSLIILYSVLSFFIFSRHCSNVWRYLARVISGKTCYIIHTVRSFTHVSSCTCHQWIEVVASLVFCSYLLHKTKPNRVQTGSLVCFRMVLEFCMFTCWNLLRPFQVSEHMWMKYNISILKVMWLGKRKLSIIFEIVG